MLKTPAVPVGTYKGKKYQVVGYKSGGAVVELAWFSDATKSFSVPTNKVEIRDQSGKKVEPKQTGSAGYYRFSTTLIGGYALNDRAVDVTKVTDPDGKNIGGAKRTQRTGGWRDRILQKFTQLSGIKVQAFGDAKGKLKVVPTMADWELIKDKIDKLSGVRAYFHVPKGWKQTALIVQVG